MKLGKIIYKNELVNHKQLEYIEYVQGDNLIIEEVSYLPTLYVGWNEIKNENKDLSISILNQTITDNWIKWTFDFNEKKDSHVLDIDNFSRNCIHYYFNVKYKYENINYLTNDINTMSGIIETLPKTIESTYVYKNSVLYIKDNNSIFGIDLDGCEYLRYNTDELKEYCKNNSTKYVDDKNGEIFINLNKEYNNNLLNIKRFIVCLV